MLDQDFRFESFTSGIYSNRLIPIQCKTFIKSKFLNFPNNATEKLFPRELNGKENKSKHFHYAKTRSIKKNFRKHSSKLKYWFS